MDRAEYIKEYNKKAEEVLEKENLPFVSEILDYANNNKVSKNLNRVFDFFDDQEEFTELIKRDKVSFSSEDSKTFIDSVIAANVTEISKSGSIYKMLMACGDNYRLIGKNCNSKGREIQAPIDEATFNYDIKDSYFYLPGNPEDLEMASDYNEFKKIIKNQKSIFVRTPMTCKHHKKRKCCPICAGKLPYGVENIGAFSTLMITEVVTQSALQSMNKGKEKNVNELLTEKYNRKNKLKEYYDWCEEILNNLKGEIVQRRFYEIALLSRLFIGEKNKIRVSSLKSPNTDNYFGEFIYKPKEKTFRDIISNEQFLDNSLKGQIALNDFKQGVFEKHVL